MNTLRPLPLLSSRLLFSNGARTTTIGVRYASTEAATATATTPEPTETASVPAIQGESNSKKPGGHRPRSILPPGHAERIWVHNHFIANHIIYSFTPEMNPTKAFRQFAYTGKKLVPAKLRKDYWRPMAVVEFGPGRGDVGRSVFHKLRELKKRHQLEWDDPAMLQMDRRARGRALNDERGNAVADIAAVLAGRGKGNRVVVGAVKEGGEEKGLVVGGAAAEAEGGNAADAKKKREFELAGLQSATVYWANEQDKYYAEEWTANVTHVVGLPEKGAKKTEEAVVVEEEAAAAAPAETEAAAETPKTEQ